MSKSNRSTVVVFISPSLILLLRVSPALGWCHLQPPEEVGGAGYSEEAALCCGRGLEVLRDVVALRRPAAVQRGWFWSEFPLWRCSIWSVGIQAPAVHRFIPSWKHHLPPGIVEAVSLVQWRDSFQPLGGYLERVTMQHPPECILLHPLPKKGILPLISTAGKHTVTLLFTLPWRRGDLEKCCYFSYGNLGGRGSSEVAQDVYSQVRRQIWVSHVCFAWVTALSAEMSMQKVQVL